MDANTLRRRLIRLHLRRARLCEAFGLWDGVRLTQRQRTRLGRMARAIKRVSAKVKEMEKKK